MKLEIKSVVKMYEAIAETMSASYKINYSITEMGDLKNVKVAADVYVGGSKIGTLQFSGENISTTQFPYSANFMTYISEFSEIVNQVKSLILVQEDINEDILEETHEDVLEETEETQEETSIDAEEYEPINTEEQ